ncbi:regulator of chromosome condensation, RCC1 [Bdellovibrio bacteriovorus W]|nr:regulator of chromosome condensation, RCC1 [Bdellovibrio bacteriovorus W]
MKKKEVGDKELSSLSRRELLLSAGRLSALGIVTSILSPHEKALAFRNTLGFWGSKKQAGLFHWGAPFGSMIKPTQIDPKEQWSQIFTAPFNTSKSFYAIKTDGTLWSWGENQYGQLGLGHRNDILSPVQVGSKKWKTLALSGYGASGIQEDGSLWAWGASDEGENGVFYDSPTKILSEFAEGWKEIWADSIATIAIKTDGSLWMWGSGTSTISVPHIPKQLSDQKWLKVGGNRASSSFLLALHENGSLWGIGYNNDGVFGSQNYIYNLTKINDGPWVNMSAGAGHVVAQKADGTLWSWGRNNRGQLGDGTYKASSSPVQVSYTGTIRELVSTAERTFVLSQEGEVWGWGSNAGAGLGVSHIAPTHVPSTKPWKMLAGLSTTTMAIAQDGTLWGWGYSSSGGLGLSSTYVFDQTLVSDAKWKYVSASNLVYGIQTDGSLWTWGFGSNGELGDGEKTIRSSPVQISSESWRLTSVGNYVGVGIKEDNTLWVTGGNSAGSLGLGDTVSRSHLTQLGGAEWRTVDVGRAGSINTHVLAIKTDGTLWAWGYNLNGQIGIGVTGAGSNKSSPVQIGNATDWVKVQGGSTFSVALKSDNTLWRWGLVGLENSNSPVQVAGSWTDVSCSEASVLAKKTDGSIWGFGSNAYGSLGNESLYLNISPNSPVKVHDGEAGLLFDCQKDLSFFIKTDGSLWAMGDNSAGNMGIKYNTPSQTIEGSGWKSLKANPSRAFVVKSDGTLWLWGHTGSSGFFASINNTYRYLIQSSKTETDWGSIENLSEHIVCVKTDGTRWLWGEGTVGQLGNGSFSNSNSPIQLQGSGWKEVSCGNKFTVALKSDGSLWSWGSNSSRSLGHTYTEPQLIDSSNWQAVAVAYRGGAGVRVDGTLWVWGTEVNTSGFLGGAGRTKMTRIGAETDWHSVQIGGSWTGPVAISQKSDQSLWSWGWASSSGLAGVANGGNRTSSPVLISGRWEKYSVNENHAIAVSTDGTLWAWGVNSTCQLGGGAVNVTQSQPIQVSTDKWQSISAGNLATMAIKSDGTLWAWGSGMSGRTGVGSSATLSSPTQIGADRNWDKVSLGYFISLGIRKK